MEEIEKFDMGGPLLHESKGIFNNKLLNQTRENYLQQHRSVSDVG